MKTKEAMELFTLEAMQKIIEQKKTIETPFLNKYFTTQIAMYARSSVFHSIPPFLSSSLQILFAV